MADLAGQNSVTSDSFITQQPSIQVAPHALRCDKLVKNLHKAASSDLPPMTFEVKDSNSSVLLKCNPGTWISILKPTITTLGEGYTRTVDGLIVSLSEGPTILMDSNGINQHDQFSFTVASNRQVPTTVQVRLFNTNQSIQVHGGGLLPNGQTAAVWFSNKVIIPLCQARTKVTKCSKEDINYIHRQIVAACAKGNDSSQEGAQGTRQMCFECKKYFNLTAKNRLPCPDCGYYFHQNHMETHSCISPSRFSVSRKRSRADTSDLASPPPPRSVRRRGLSDIDSDDSETDDQQAAGSPLPDALSTVTSGVTVAAALLPPSQPDAPPETADSSIVLSTGQQELARALHQPASGVTTSALVQRHQPLPPPPPPQKPAKGKGRTKTRADGLALTPEALQNELLQRNITETQARLTLLEHLVKEKDDSIGILNTRIQCFERLENDARYNQRFSPSTATTPSTSPPQAAACSPCCPSSTLLSEFSKVQQQIEDLSGAVSIVLKSVQHPTLLPSNQTGPAVPELQGTQEASTQTCQAVAPQRGVQNFRYIPFSGVDVRFPPPALPRNTPMSQGLLEQPAFFELEPEGLQAPLVPEQLIQQPLATGQCVQQPSALEQLVWPEIEHGLSLVDHQQPPPPPAHQPLLPSHHGHQPHQIEGAPAIPGLQPHDMRCLEDQLSDVYPMPRYVKPKTVRKQKHKRNSQGQSKASNPPVFSRTFWNSTSPPLIDLNL